ncbi:hypothetical protein [Shewanella woodyi]|uniref:hypothetical protein n=1 Tax=Shewanella woodyi TaxID=60961 RepID=UPI0037494B96
MKKLAFIAIVVGLSGCATIHKVNTVDPESLQFATLEVPTYVMVGQVDGKGVSNPLCSGPLCHGGIEIKLKPGKRSISFKYADGHWSSRGYSVVNYQYEADRQYVLKVSKTNFTVNYSVTEKEK